MEVDMIKSTLVKAIKEHMGFKPGQNLTDFMNEIKALTPEDRTYFAREYAKIGIEIVSA
jgi:hypothetical protein